jgi:hypothetical protein
MTPVRKEQIKAIHVLKGQSGLTDADYRVHLKERFKVVSSKDLSEAQAGVLMDDLRGLGGKKAPRTSAKRASGKFAAVLQALWLAGYNLGVVDNPDDAALLAFVKRQCKVDHDRFLSDGVEAAKAIEGLKSWICREAGFAAFGTQAKADAVFVSLKTFNKRLVCAEIERRIRAHGLADFDIDSFACLERLPPLAKCDDRQLDKLAAKMGAVLRRQLGRA